VPAACKLQVKQNKALISNFGKEYGEEAADLLGWLQASSPPVRSSLFPITTL
jgi:hypothetical protein